MQAAEYNIVKSRFEWSDTVKNSDENIMEKVALFIVDKRKAFYLLFAIALCSAQFVFLKFRLKMIFQRICLSRLKQSKGLI